MSNMDRFSRILATLLLLRGGRAVSASALAKRFGVSARTVYRDMDSLSALGVPVYAERGRDGGFQLLEGYFLPPVMFSEDEAIALLLSQSLFHSLAARPFEAAMHDAVQKLLAALPDSLRATMERAHQVVGFEPVPEDVFHPDYEDAVITAAREVDESQVIETGFRAVLGHTALKVRYQSPYRTREDVLLLEPHGAFWDRTHWYLVATPLDPPGPPRPWRADRFLSLQPAPGRPAAVEFDIETFLGRKWLDIAMRQWAVIGPVTRIRMTPAQMQNLQRDWYYGRALFEPVSDDAVLMTYGEDRVEAALQLVRWLGPGAELVEPAEWRAQLYDELRQMATVYRPDL